MTQLSAQKQLAEGPAEDSDSGQWQAAGPRPSALLGCSPGRTVVPAHSPGTYRNTGHTGPSTRTQGPHHPGWAVPSIAEPESPLGPASQLWFDRCFSAHRAQGAGRRADRSSRLSSCWAASTLPVAGLPRSPAPPSLPVLRFQQSSYFMHQKKSFQEEEVNAYRFSFLCVHFHAHFPPPGARAVLTSGPSLVPTPTAPARPAAPRVCAALGAGHCPTVAILRALLSPDCAGGSGLPPGRSREGGQHGRVVWRHQFCFLQDRPWPRGPAARWPS